MSVAKTAFSEYLNDVSLVFFTRKICLNLMYLFFQECCKMTDENTTKPYTTRLFGTFAFSKKPLVCQNVCQFAIKNTRKI